MSNCKIPKGTTSELSEQLLNAGLTYRTADMCIIKLYSSEMLIDKDVEYEYREIHHYDACSVKSFPSWSLDALINLLPNEIADYETDDDRVSENYTCYGLTMNRYNLSYRTIDGSGVLCEFKGNYLLECVVKAVCYLLDSGWSEDVLMKS